MAPYGHKSKTDLLLGVRILQSGLPVPPGFFPIGLAFTCCICSDASEPS